MHRALIFIAFATSISPAIAAPEGRTTRVGVNNEPNQIVCRNERAIGSRLRANRVCRTRAEWTEYRRQTRQAIERAQHDIQSASSD
jgi:hypothetical protein